MTGEPGAAGSGPAALPELARLLGGLVAPTTLLTGLLYYFGWLHAYDLFGYFGVNSTALGFGTADYLIRSVDALYVPLAVTAVAALLALWGNTALQPRLRAGPAWFRDRFLLALAAAGAALTLAGAVVTMVAHGSGGAYTALAPLGFGLGVVVAGYAAHLRRVLRPSGPQAEAAAGWTEAAQWMIIFLLIAVSLFTAAADYAGAVGLSRAYKLEAELRTDPAAVLYSQHGLDLPATADVTETRCARDGDSYEYRYDGLVLVLESGGKYLLLPRRWTRADGGAALLLSEDDPIRLEFYPAAVAVRRESAAC